MIKRLTNQSGYSLVEVMVAILILSIAILPMVGMFDAGLRAAVLGGNYDSGRALANEKLEEVKALSYGEAVAQHPPGSPDTGTEGAFEYKIETDYARVDPDTGEIEASEDARTMMQVAVTVTWDGNKEYRTIGLVSG